MCWRERDLKLLYFAWGSVKKKLWQTLKVIRNQSRQLWNFCINLSSIKNDRTHFCNVCIQSKRAHMHAVWKRTGIQAYRTNPFLPSKKYPQNTELDSYSQRPDPLTSEMVLLLLPFNSYLMNKKAPGRIMMFQEKSYKVVICSQLNEEYTVEKYYKIPTTTSAPVWWGVFILHLFAGSSIHKDSNSWYAYKRPKEETKIYFKGCEILSFWV